MLRRFAGDYSLALAHHIKSVGGQIGERLFFSVGPQDFGLIDALMTAQPEVYPKVVLREIASATQNFACLYEVSGGGSYARIQCEAIRLHTFQLKTDPMILRAAFRTQDHGLADQIFNDCLHLSVIEQITNGKAAAHLRDLNRISGQPAGILESSVSLIDEQALRLADIWRRCERGPPADRRVR